MALTLVYAGVNLNVYAEDTDPQNITFEVKANIGDDPVVRRTANTPADYTDTVATVKSIADTFVPTTQPLPPDVPGVRALIDADILAGGI